MTTADTRITKLPLADDFRLPDPPWKPDNMSLYDHLSATGNAHHVAQHIGYPETTIVTSDHYLVEHLTQNMAGSHYPDMLIALNADPVAYRERNGYVIAEQGKPPDFVLEIASPSTGHIDTGAKRIAYAELGIPEYWRFDETGSSHGTRLAGDRLVNGKYEPIPITELADGSLQGYSAVLNLYLRWENGELGWYDPATGQHIPTFDSEQAERLQERAERLREQDARLQAEARANREQAERIREQAERIREQAERLQAEARADREQARADREQAERIQEQDARLQAEARAEREQDARLQAEARMREMEAELRRLQNG